MKKLFILLVTLLGVFSLGFSFAGCQDVDWNNAYGNPDGDLCIDIQESGNDWKLGRDLSGRDNTTIGLRCEIIIMEAGNSPTVVPGCNGDFDFNGYDTEIVKIYVYVGVNNDSYYGIIEEKFNFDDGERDDNHYDDNDVENFKVTADPDDADEDEWVDITVKARNDNNNTMEDYDNDIVFKVYRKSGSYRLNITSREGQSNYFDIDSDYDNDFDNGIKFRSSRNGEHEFKNFIKFRNYSYDYKILVEDDNNNDISGYDIIYVNNGGTSSDKDLDDFDIDWSDTRPERDKYIDLEIKAIDYNNDPVDNYDGRVYYTVQYRTSSSSSWRTASYSYYDINNTYDNGYIKFSSYRDGEKDIPNFIKFKREYDFRLLFDDRSEDVERYSATVYVDNNSGSNNVDEIKAYIDNRYPEEDKKVDLTLEVLDEDDNKVEDYDGTIKYEVKYRTSSSSSWKTANSSYYDVDNDYDDGEIKFKSSWNGRKHFNNFIEFKKDYEFKLIFEDEDDNDVTGRTKTIYVGDDDDSDIDGFTQNELDQLHNMHIIRDILIDNLEDKSSRLRNSFTRRNISDKFKYNMEDVLDNKSNREFGDYNDFEGAFLEWVEYTKDLLD